MVFQNYALYPYMTVFENIAFGLRARKTPKRGDRGQGAAGRADAGDRATCSIAIRASSPAASLQRVAIGRAIVRNARLYLFDEPLSNLDAQLRDEMRGEIKRLHQELGKTMIYVTHDQIEAMTMADRIVLMRDGRIEQQGAPLDLYERPATRYVAGFLGSPAMNFVDAALVGATTAASPCGWPTAPCWRCPPARTQAPGGPTRPGRSCSACGPSTSAARDGNARPGVVTHRAHDRSRATDRRAHLRDLQARRRGRGGRAAGARRVAAWRAASSWRST